MLQRMVIDHQMTHSKQRLQLSIISLRYKPKVRSNIKLWDCSTDDVRASTTINKKKGEWYLFWNMLNDNVILHHQLLEYPEIPNVCKWVLGHE